MSDLFFDVFFLILDCFFGYSRPFIYLQLVLKPRGRTGAIKSIGPKMAVLRPFPRGKESVGEKKQKIENILKKAKMGYILT